MISNRFSLIFLALINLGATDEKYKQVYEAERQKIVEADEVSRETMGLLYQINERMKLMSRKRSNLTDKILSTESRVRELTRAVIKLESDISTQRKNLAKRLKAIYMLGDDGVARILFSSLDANDLDQSLRFLKKISENDYRSIKLYEKNLATLVEKKNKVAAEVRGLIQLKQRLDQQEQRLTSEQLSKGKLLQELNRNRENALKNITNIRKVATVSKQQSDLDVSFFEQKGLILKPVVGTPIQDFGLIKNSKYKYELSHKGVTFQLAGESRVMAVHDGLVEFAGKVIGYGHTVILDHGDHYYTVYANLKKYLVKEKDRVTKNNQIAWGEGTMYFEIRHFSDAIDPKPWFSKGPPLTQANEELL